MFYHRLHENSNECFDISAGNDNNADIDTATNMGTRCNDQLKISGKDKSKVSSKSDNLASEVVLQEPLVISDSGNKICVVQIPSKKHVYDATIDPARPHKCWVCQAAFRKISHLKQHHRRHTGERPYRCTKCDRCITNYYSFFLVSFLVYFLTIFTFTYNLLTFTSLIAGDSRRTVC